jgi:hypothetical protein
MKDENPFKKGQLLVVKTPPYYTKEYFYEVISAGGKQVRASLYHSPKVKKSWSIEELKLLIEHGVIRLAQDGEQPAAASSKND